MTRLALGVVIGLGLGIVVAAAAGIHAAGTEPDEDTIAAAQQAGVSPGEVLGALNSLEAAGILTDARGYLNAEGMLAAPIAPLPAAPAVPDLRTYAYQTYPRWARCIEAIVQVESRGWFTRGWNPVPWGRFGEHASGLGGFLPSTWASTPQGRAGRSIWDGYAQVDAIAWMLSAGRGREFAAYSWGRCG